jgi:sterol desaturase/sphingolipid hydroxylase (fatty acid hydroxylase superfamily)
MTARPWLTPKLAGICKAKADILPAISSCKSVPITGPQIEIRESRVFSACGVVQMSQTAIANLSAEVMRRIRHFGDFFTLPLAIVIFVAVAGIERLHLVLAGLAAWTLMEYLVHRFAFHRYSWVGQRLHQLHHDHPSDPDSERSSLSTPLLAFPIGVLLMSAAGVKDGSAIFAGLILGYLIFIAIHYAVHRWPIKRNSWLYSAKMRHLAHHHFENCNYGVTTIFWDIVFRTNARTVGGQVHSEAG